MRIGLLLLAAGRKAGGPETYEVELVRALVQRANEQQSDDEYFVYCTGHEGPAAIGLQDPRLHYRVLKPANRFLSLSVSLPVRCLLDRLDILHAAYAPPPYCPVPVVFTLHCLSNLLHPEFYDARKVFRLNQLQKLGLQRAKRVLTVSRFVADGANQHFGVPWQRLEVVYNGLSPNFRPWLPSEAEKILSPRLPVDHNYILYVGKLQARKNLVRLLAAYQIYRENTGTRDRLVLLGRETETSEEIRAAMQTHPFRDDIIHLDYLPQSDPKANNRNFIAALYSRCRFFVFPSLYEGFGFPVLEAMACGAPTITSNTTSLPEVAGEACQLIDPENLDELAAAMIRLGQNDSLRAQANRLGLLQAARFSWRRCAEETRRAYDTALLRRPQVQETPAAVQLGSAPSENVEACNEKL